MSKRNKRRNKSNSIKSITIIAILLLLLVLVLGAIKLFLDNQNAVSMPDNLLETVSENSFDVKEKEEEIEKKEVKNPIVKIMMVGDNLLHIPAVDSGKKDDGSYNFDHYFKNILPYIEDADISIINQETMLAGEELGISAYPQFNSPKEVADAINKAGFNVVTHANNHAMDKGYEGIRLTIDNWDRFNNINLLGINRTEEEFNTIQVIEVNDIKISLLSYTFSLNGIALPKDKPWLVNLMDKEKMKIDIEKAKEVSDFVIVIPHWGEEYVYKPNSFQLDMATFFSDNGVNLVLGSHPHVLQPVEWLENSSGEKMLVYYSLGNFLSNQNRPPRMLGGMAMLEIEKNLETGVAEIKNPEIIPLVTHYEWGKWDTSYTTYPLKDYTKELAKKHGVMRKETNDNGEVVKKEAFSLEWLDSLCLEILGENWYIK